MTSEYGRRDAAGPRAPSGGRLDRPIGGLGKLPTGVHTCTVLSVVRHPRRVTVILQAFGGECHAESVEWWPETLAVGVSVRARVGLGPGAYVVRDGGRFQAREHPTQAPLTDWLDSVQAVYFALDGRALAVTQLEAVDSDLLETTYVPRVCADPASVRARTQTRAADPADRGGVAGGVGRRGPATPGPGDGGPGPDGPDQAGDDPGPG